MQEIVFSLDLNQIFIIFCMVLPLYWLLIKKQIYSIFDPLLFFIVFNSMSISLVIYLYVNNMIKEEYFIFFILGILSFIIGIQIGGMKKIKLNQYHSEDFFSNYSLTIDIALIVITTILVLANTFLFVKKGTLPIFSDNPTEAKVTLYTGGYGIIRRLNFALSYFALAIPLLKLFHPFLKIGLQKRVYYSTILLIISFIVVSMGSKSGLLIVLNILFAILMINMQFKSKLFQHYNGLVNNVKIKKWSRRILFLSLAFVFLVLFLTGNETSIMDSLIVRLIMSGDTFYFFYTYDLEQFFHHNCIDYIPHILNVFTSMVRITDYEYPIGVLIMNYSLNLPIDKETSFGPNAQYPVEGLIYFGKYGMLLYAFVIGYVISYFRVSFINKVLKKPDFINLLLYCIISSMIIIIATDVTYFFTVFFDVVLYGVIVLGISLVLSKLIRNN